MIKTEKPPTRAIEKMYIFLPESESDIKYLLSLERLKAYK